MRADGKKSFEELAVPHLDTVFRVAIRLTRNDHEAEDLVQETYLKACKAFDQFEMREFGIRPWLLRILHNTFLNRMTREKRAPKATEQQRLEQVRDDASASDFFGPPALDYEHLDAEVKTALDRLAPEFRVVLSLWATMEFSYQEIADILDMPIGTVMSRLHRARQQLLRDLDEYAREHRLAGGARKK
ncbi:MAG: sigma-70 family RNA polymerase sigma factor [Phycisphaerae bacterium]